MKAYYNNILSIVNHKVTAVCMFIVSIMVIILFIQVIFRYILNNSLDWPNELSRFLLIWLTFLGMSIATWDKGHLLIDFFKRTLPNKYNNIITLITYSLIILFLTTAFISSFKAIKFSFGISLTSLPLSWGHAFISFPIGAGLCILYYLNFIINKRID